MEYRFINDLNSEIAVPDEGIISRVIHKDEFLNVTLFGFSKGQELSTHSAPTPAVLQLLSGEADVRLGEDTVKAKPGSFVYMPPTLPHAISATSECVMLLIQVKILRS
jgi:quercetin dioxygenase-like cupin family protein